MEYTLGKKLEEIEQKLDLLLMKAYPEEFKKEEKPKKKSEAI